MIPLSLLYGMLKFFDWCRRGDTSSFTIEIVKIARKFAEFANSRRFLSPVDFSLVSLILDILSGALS